MKYDFSVVLKNGDGSSASENGSPATAIMGLKNALIADMPGLTGTDKGARFDLWLKLSNATTEALELTLDELNVLRRAIEVYPTLVYGQLLRIINQR